MPEPDDSSSRKPVENDRNAPEPETLPPEKVEDRPNVSQVKPEDYPVDQRARGD